MEGGKLGDAALQRFGLKEGALGGVRMDTQTLTNKENALADQLIESSLTQNKDGELEITQTLTDPLRKGASKTETSSLGGSLMQEAWEAFQNNEDIITSLERKSFLKKKRDWAEADADSSLRKTHTSEDILKEFEQRNKRILETEKSKLLKKYLEENPEDLMFLRGTRNVWGEEIFKTGSPLLQSHLGGGDVAAGGLIPKFHKGGLVPNYNVDSKGEVLAKLLPGEMVIPREGVAAAAAELRRDPVDKSAGKFSVRKTLASEMTARQPFVPNYLPPGVELKYEALLRGWRHSAQAWKDGKQIGTVTLDKISKDENLFKSSSFIDEAHHGKRNSKRTSGNGLQKAPQRLEGVQWGSSSSSVSR